MKKHGLFALWGALFALCATLGFLVATSPALNILMTILSVAFFIPPALLLHMAAREGDQNTLALIRNLSLASLVLTVFLIMANFFSALGSALVGNILNSILIIVSTPMICSGYWVLSLFLWACLMITAAKLLKRK